MRNLFFSILGLMALLPGAALAQASDEIALVRQIFAQIQPLSFRDNREYCGYIGLNAEGQLTATPATRGRVDSCFAADPDELEILYASYHTHGGYVPEDAVEVPSGEDVEGDADEGVDGYVATPGGRLWYIDTEDMVISQICGIGCLPSDPRFLPGASANVAPSYSYDQLVRFLD